MNPESVTLSNKRFSFDDPVSFKIFSWAIGVILILAGYVVKISTDTQDRVQSSNNQQANVLIQLSQIQADLIWIKANINK